MWAGRLRTSVAGHVVKVNGTSFTGQRKYELLPESEQRSWSFTSPCHDKDESDLDDFLQEPLNFEKGARTNSK